MKKKYPNEYDNLINAAKIIDNPHRNHLHDVMLIEKQQAEIAELKVQCNSYGKRLILKGEDDITFYASDFPKTIKGEKQ